MTSHEPWSACANEGLHATVSATNRATLVVGCFTGMMVPMLRSNLIVIQSIMTAADSVVDHCFWKEINDHDPI